jgi:hypothetical protein
MSGKGKSKKSELEGVDMSKREHKKQVGPLSKAEQTKQRIGQEEASVELATLTLFANENLSKTRELDLSKIIADIDLISVKDESLTLIQKNISIIHVYLAFLQEMAMKYPIDKVFFQIENYKNETERLLRLYNEKKLEIEIEIEEKSESKPVFPITYASKNVLTVNDIQDIPELSEIKGIILTKPKQISEDIEITIERKSISIDLDNTIIVGGITKEKTNLIRALRIACELGKMIDVEEDRKTMRKMKGLTVGDTFNKKLDQKIYHEIKTTKFSSESPITEIISYLKADKIESRTRENVSNDGDLKEPQFKEEDVSIGNISAGQFTSLGNIKFTKFVAAPEDDKKYTLESFFNPIAKTIFFIILKRNSNVETYKTVYHSNYRIDEASQEIIFRPYSEVEAHIPKKSGNRQNIHKDVFNFIYFINSRERTTPSINEKSPWYDVEKKINKMKEDDKEYIKELLVNEEDYNKELKILHNKYTQYTRVKKEHAIPITEFDETFSYKKRGSDYLPPSQVENFKRFGKLDERIKLYSHREIQQNLVPKQKADEQGGYEPVFTLEMKVNIYEKIFLREVFVDKLKNKLPKLKINDTEVDTHPKLTHNEKILIKQYFKDTEETFLKDIFIKKHSSEEIKEASQEQLERMKLELTPEENTRLNIKKKQITINHLVLSPEILRETLGALSKEDKERLEKGKIKVAAHFTSEKKQLYNKVIEIVKPVDFGFTRPFLLTDLLLSKYYKDKLADVLAINKDTVLHWFHLIEELRSIVFTFVSMYYTFENKDNQSYYEISRNKTKGKDDIKEENKIISIPLNKVYQKLPYYGEYSRKADAINVVKNVKFYSRLLNKKDDNGYGIIKVIDELKESDRPKRISLFSIEEANDDYKLESAILSGDKSKIDKEFDRIHSKIISEDIEISESDVTSKEEVVAFYPLLPCKLNGDILLLPEENIETINNSSADTYIFYGPGINNDNESGLPVRKILTLDGNRKVFVTVDEGNVKLIFSDGQLRFFKGTIEELDVSKIDEYQCSSEIYSIKPKGSNFIKCFHKGRITLKDGDNLDNIKPENYIFVGPGIKSDDPSGIRVLDIKNVSNGTKVFLTEDSSLVKMIFSDNNELRYYEGNISNFDSSKINTYKCSSLPYYIRPKINEDGIRCTIRGRIQLLEGYTMDRINDTSKSSYIFYGGDKNGIPVSKIKMLPDRRKVFLAVDGSFVKMILNDGEVRYYEGTLTDFNYDNINKYNCPTVPYYIKPKEYTTSFGEGSDEDDEGSVVKPISFKPKRRDEEDREALAKRRTRAKLDFIRELIKNAAANTFDWKLKQYFDVQQVRQKIEEKINEIYEYRAVTSSKKGTGQKADGTIDFIKNFDSGNPLKIKKALVYIISKISFGILSRDLQIKFSTNYKLDENEITDNVDFEEVSFTKKAQTLQTFNPTKQLSFDLVKKFKEMYKPIHTDSTGKKSNNRLFDSLDQEDLLLLNNIKQNQRRLQEDIESILKKKDIDVDNSAIKNGLESGKDNQIVNAIWQLAKKYGYADIPYNQSSAYVAQMEKEAEERRTDGNVALLKQQLESIDKLFGDSDALSKHTAESKTMLYKIRSELDTQLTQLKSLPQVQPKEEELNLEELEIVIKSKLSNLTDIENEVKKQKFLSSPMTDKLNKEVASFRDEHTIINDEITKIEEKIDAYLLKIEGKNIEKQKKMYEMKILLNTCQQKLTLIDIKLSKRMDNKTVTSSKEAKLVRLQRGDLDSLHTKLREVNRKLKLPPKSEETENKYFTMTEDVNKEEHFMRLYYKYKMKYLKLKQLYSNIE